MSGFNLVLENLLISTGIPVSEIKGWIKVSISYSRIFLFQHMRLVTDTGESNGFNLVLENLLISTIDAFENPIPRAPVSISYSRIFLFQLRYVPMLQTKTIAFVSISYSRIFLFQRKIVVLSRQPEIPCFNLVLENLLISTFFFHLLRRFLMFVSISYSRIFLFQRTFGCDLDRQPLVSISYSRIFLFQLKNEKGN